MFSFKNIKLARAVIVLILFSMLFVGCSRQADPAKLDKMLRCDGGRLYYSSVITYGEARKMVDYLARYKFFKHDNPNKSAQLTKKEKVYQFRIVGVEGKENDAYYIDVVKLLATDISKEVFDGAPAEIHLCDKQFNTLRAVAAEQ